MSGRLTLHTSRYAPGERHAPHWHSELQLSLVLEGALAETSGGQRVLATPLSVAVKDAGVVHGDEFGPRGARMARLELPQGTLASLLDDPRRATAWGWRHEPEAAGPFLRLVARGAEASGSFATDDPDLVDLLAALSTPETPAAGSPPRWLVDIRRRVEAEWTPELSVSTVAAWAGVHPVYLARCFRRFYGKGVAEELRWQRLRRATAELLGRRRDVAGVAHDAGFADEAHFSRSFRALSGLAPGRFRERLRCLPFAPSPAPRGR